MSTAKELIKDKVANGQGHNINNGWVEVIENQTQQRLKPNWKILNDNDLVQNLVQKKTVNVEYKTNVTTHNKK